MDLYLDHGAYGTSSNRIGLDAPTTWGVPQEGDGYATGASTAAAVAEVKVNAVPTNGDTLVVAGVVMTAGSSASANTFNKGANVAATASGIVALINSANCTNVVGSSVAHNTGIASNANQGRNMFYAQVKSGATDTVQIMFRIGSDALNHANNSNVAITTTGTWGGSAPTITQFTGGVSGCFGWFCNPSALGQSSSIAAMAYGLIMAKPTVVRGATSASSVYALSESDIVWLRTGSGQTVNFSIAANTLRNASANNLHLRADSNTKWTGDSGNGVFEFKVTNSTAFTHVFGITGPATSRVKWSAATKGQLKFTGLMSGTSGCGLSLGTNSSTGVYALEFNNVTVEEDATSAQAGFNCMPMPVGNSSCTVILRDCIFNLLKASSTGRTLLQLGAAGSYVNNYTIDGCEWNFNYTGVAAPTQPLIGVYGTTTAKLRCKITGGKITGLGAYSQPIFGMTAAWAASYVPIELSAENVSGSSVGSNGLAPWLAPQQGWADDARRVFVSSPDLGGSWRYESNTGAADWVNDGTFPTLNGRTPSNVAHSTRVFWLPTTGSDYLMGYRAPPLKQQSRGTSGTKTIVVEMLLPSAITFDALNFAARLRYVDTSGVAQSMTLTGADLASSSASWDNAGGYSGHAAKKLTFTTTASVKQYTDITVELSVYGPSPTGSLAYLFVDPGFSVT